MPQQFSSHQSCRWVKDAHVCQTLPKLSFQQKNPAPCLLFELLQESAIAYRIDLKGGGALAVHIHLVYNSPQELEPVAEGGVLQRRFEWFCVSRAACSRSCQGPLLRTVQRFGPAGSKRSDSTDCATLVKSPEQLHISVDEACSHQNHRLFR